MRGKMPRDWLRGQEFPLFVYTARSVAYLLLLKPALSLCCGTIETVVTKHPL